MNIPHEIIKELLINAPEGVHTVMYALKKVDNVETDEYALAHYVEKKVPISELAVDQIIPKNISIDGKDYKTDVVENPKFKALQCNSLNATNVRFLQTYHRPLSAGLEISNLSTVPYYNYIGPANGTLGIIAVDNYDNTLVGVTNNHVAILDAFNSAERDTTKQIWNTYDPLYHPFYNKTYTSVTSQYGTYDSKGTNFMDGGIGRPKRYCPFTTDPNATNYLDCALVALNSGTVDSTSACQAELANTYALPFATTSEINTVLNSPVGTYSIYSVGRTTGPKGISCPMEIFSYGASYTAYNKQGVIYTSPTDVSVLISDVLFYRFKDQSNLPIYSGDSGSGVYVNINGVNKIIGVAYAGDTSSPNGVPTSTNGVLCRIDHIATILNISAWDGSFTRFTPNTQQSISYILRPSNDNRTSINYNGKTYHQAGLKITSENITNA
jgi:hypothetical protein